MATLGALSLALTATGCRSNESRVASDLNQRALQSTEFPEAAGGYRLSAWEIVPARSTNGSDGGGSVTAHYVTEGGIVHASVTRVTVPGSVPATSWVSHDRLLVALKSASPKAEPTERGTLSFGDALVVYLSYQVPSDSEPIHGCLATTFADEEGRSAYLLRAQSAVTDRDPTSELDPKSLLGPLLRELLSR